MDKHHNINFIVAIIVVAQFACTSLWFAGNAVLPDLQTAFDLPPNSISDLTTAVQFGFIFGTLVFALLGISDRYSPSKVFFVCALLGALANYLVTTISSTFLLYTFRGLVGFFLAGIYPVGMKISADYREKGLGKALGFLVGALVVGTALPHLLNLFKGSFNWHQVIYTTSILAVAGGAVVFFFIPDGPFRKKGGKIDLSLCFVVFKDRKFRGAAFGYFGHMWELYTLWAYVPFILSYYCLHNGIQMNIPLLSFIIIAIGGPACVIGGYFADVIGSAKMAFYALMASGLCCLISIFSFHFASIGFVLFLILWGMSVVADSPQFSTLVAQYAPAETRGSALTIVNSIGFAITIASLQFIDILLTHLDTKIVFALLALGPILGLIAINKSKIIA